MFLEFKQKIVKDYSILTTILLLFVSLSIYFTGIYISYKEQLYHLKMLAIEESEELFYIINTHTIEDFSSIEEIPNIDDGYFNKIFIYGYNTKHQALFKHNNMLWSKDFIDDVIKNNNLEFHKVYIHFKLVDNRHPKAFMYMRYPLIEKNTFLGEIYVGIEITHFVREQVRIFFILLLIIFLSMFFIRYIAYKMANKAMVPIINSFEQQKQFIANASHELRTPLSIIISGMMVLKSDESNKLSSFSQDIINDIDEEAFKMKKLIDTLLLTARNDNDTLKVHFIDFSLQNLIIKLYNKFSLLATEKQIDISIDTLIIEHIHADITHIEQILSILLDNAIKYTDNNGKITINTKKDDDFIYISVKDTGKGISKEDLPHIFERFYRADKARTHYGNGLGLSIAQMLAQKNNSKIIVSSTQKSGSCFTLIIKRHH